MVLDRALLGGMLASAGRLLQRESGVLSEIDSRFGDGDHGVTMNKIGQLIEREAAEWGDEPPGEFLTALGDDVMAIGGGSAGPLYGTLIAGFGAPLGECREIDATTLKNMFAACREAMFEITPAKVGDKTMMDALIPAVDAALEAPDDVAAILRAAAEAAEAGAKSSEAFASKFGRAKLYKEQTIGTPDAGATSTALFFRGFLEGIDLK